MNQAWQELRRFMSESLVGLAAKIAPAESIADIAYITDLSAAVRKAVAEAD